MDFNCILTIQHLKPLLTVDIAELFAGIASYVALT